MPDTKHLLEDGFSPEEIKQWERRVRKQTREQAREVIAFVQHHERHRWKPTYEHVDSTSAVDGAYDPYDAHDECEHCGLHRVRSVELTCSASKSLYVYFRMRDGVEEAVYPHEDGRVPRCR